MKNLFSIVICSVLLPACSPHNYFTINNDHSLNGIQPYSDLVITKEAKKGIASPFPDSIAIKNKFSSAVINNLKIGNSHIEFEMSTIDSLGNYITYITPKAFTFKDSSSSLVQIQFDPNCYVPNNNSKKKIMLKFKQKINEVSTSNESIFTLDKKLNTVIIKTKKLNTFNNKEHVLIKLKN